MVNKLNQIKVGNSIAIIKSKHSDWPEITCYIKELDQTGVMLNRVEHLNDFFPKSSREDGTFYIRFQNIESVKDWFEY